MYLIRCVSALLLALPLLAAAPAAAGPQEDLIEAVRRDDGRKVQTLLLRGVSTNVQDPTSGPAIVIAAQERSYDALRALLLSPATEIDARNPAGETALMYAALHGELDIVRLLVGKRAEVNQTGWTALHYAASGGHLSVVQFLLEHNAYIDAPSPNGTTPLMMAARQGHATVARHLIQEGADPAVRNEARLDAADYFARGGDTDQADWMRAQARSFLRKHGIPATQPR